MHFSIPSLLSLLATLSSTSAMSHQIANNWCNTPLYVTFNGSRQTTGPTLLPSRQAVLLNITGTGNSLGISRNSQFYSPSTPKLVLGTSTSNGVLYWSVNDVDGNPFGSGGKWNVTSSGTSPNVCGSTTTYGPTVYSCPDNNQLLSLNLCTGLAPQ